MVGYFVQVTGMTVPQLRQFVRENMPSQKELLRRMRLAGLPEDSFFTGFPLTSFAERYEKIPSKDLTIRVMRVEGYAAVVQHSSGGLGSRKDRDALRRIVQRHIVRKLRAAGHPCTESKV